MNLCVLRQIREYFVVRAGCDHCGNIWNNPRICQECETCKKLVNLENYLRTVNLDDPTLNVEE